MKKGLTELVFILDKSGSMMSLTQDTIGGFNSMIEKQKNEAGEAKITTVLFNNNYHMLHNCVDINEVSSMTEIDYVAYGTTALFDAVGMTIDLVGERLARTPEEERPEKVIFVITTDGAENASREYTRTKVKEMIEHQQNKYSWTFMFLGANIDAEDTGRSFGIKEGYSKTYTASSIGTESLYSAVADTISYCRSVDACFSSVEEIDAAVTCCLDSIV